MFLCFSSGDRYTAAKACLYHLKNFGIPVWYDYHELILGDKKAEKNFEYAINSSEYFIIIYSHSFFNSPCAIIEEQTIFSQVEKRKIFIFPLLYNIKFNELPIEYQKKIENLIYNEITDYTGCINSINQVVTKFLIDKINSSNLYKTPTLSSIDLSHISDFYLQKIVYNYNEIAAENFNARIAMLLCIFEYIKYHYGIPNNYKYTDKIMSYLFKFTNLNIMYNHKEIIIAELVILILLKINFKELH